MNLKSDVDINLESVGTYIIGECVVLSGTAVDILMTSRIVASV